jgi:hypothetical protein
MPDDGAGLIGPTTQPVLPPPAVAMIDDVAVARLEEPDVGEGTSKQYNG